MQYPLKIIIVDDHEIFRKGLRLYIGSIKNVKIIAEAENGEEFLLLLRDHKPDIVFMDIKMPVMDGEKATKIALELFPDLNIVALSMFGEEDQLYKMIDAGVKGFILKNIKKNELERVIQAVADGRSFFSEELLVYFTKKYINTKEQEKHNDLNLTRRELEILQLIANGNTNQEIADKLGISLRTIDGHKSNMISRTGSKNIINLLTYAIKNKLVELP